jgi:hypothetical protein
MHIRPDCFLAVVFASFVCSGCGSTLSTASLGIPAPGELPKLPSLPAEHGRSSLPPIETYALVARGATTCWFGAGGPLKKTLVFYADADPPSSGGKAEIALLERIEGAETNRGARAYRIGLVESAGGTTIEQSNVKLPAALAEAVEADVLRFARGKLECAGVGPTAPQPEVVVPQSAQSARVTRSAVKRPAAKQKQ